MHVKKKRYRSRMEYNAADGTTRIIDLCNAGVAFGGTAVDDKKLHKKMFPNAKKLDKKQFQSALTDTNIPANLNPNTDDMLAVPFRMLSATIVGSGTWKSTDFRNERVLQDAAPLLVGRTVYREHMDYVDYWLGKVMETTFTQSFIQGGQRIPAGIDALLLIDTDNADNLNIANGIVKGAINSNSVSVEFEWEPSHEFENEWDFEWHIGDIVEGREVTRVVTRIVAFHETSIVAQGADPYAKRIDANGELVEIGSVGTGMEIGHSATDDDNETVQSFKKEVRRHRYSVNNTGNKAETRLASFSKNVLNYLKRDADKKETDTVKLGANFGAKLDELVNAQMDAQQLNRTDMLQRVADACGCTLRNIQNYVNGKTTCPSMDMCKSMASVLMCGVSDLVMAAESDGCVFASDELESEFNAETISQIVDARAERIANGKTTIQNGCGDDDDMGDDSDDDDDSTDYGNAGDVDDKTNEPDTTKTVMDNDGKSDGDGAGTLDARMSKLEKGMETLLQKLASDATTDQTTDVTTDQTSNQDVTPTNDSTDVDTADGNMGADAGKDATMESMRAENQKLRKQLDAEKEGYKTQSAKYASRIEKLEKENRELTKQNAVNAAELENHAQTRKDLVKAENANLDYKNQIEQFQKDSHFTKLGKEHHAEMVEKAVAFYRASVGDDASDAVVGMIEKATTLEELNGLIQQYGKKLASKHTFRCKDCQSSNYEFASVKQMGETENAKTEYNQTAVPSDDALMLQYSQKKNGLHGK